MKKGYIAMAMVLAALAVHTGCNRAKMNYTGIDCPKCGSHEVVTTGNDANGAMECICLDCGTRFTAAE